MKKLAAIVAALVACLVVVVIVAFCRSSSFQDPTIANTMNKQPDWHINFLKTRISSLQPANGGIQITGRVFGSPDAKTRTVPVGHKITFPDDHGSNVYTIAGIRSDGIVIEYESTFDHRSFGRNLIERDRGTLTLPWLSESGISPPATTARSEALSRDEQVQVLLLQRMLDQDKSYFERAGRTVYMSVGADLHLVGADPQSPSDAVMAAIGQRSYVIRRLSEYLKSVGGYGNWRQKGELIDVLWIGPLKWIDENTVEAAAGRSLGPLESHGEHLRLHRKDGQWHIEALGAWKT